MCSVPGMSSTDCLLFLFGFMQRGCYLIPPLTSKIFFILASLPLFIGVGIGVFGHPWTDIPPKDLRTGLKVNILII